MKVYPKAEFLKLPAGVIWSYYNPTCLADLQGLQVKLSGPSDNGDKDFVCQEINPFGTGDEDSEDTHIEDWLAMDEEIKDSFAKGLVSKEYPIGKDEGGREGLFDNDLMYAVYSQEDILIMIGHLASGLDKDTVIAFLNNNE